MQFSQYCINKVTSTTRYNRAIPIQYQLTGNTFSEGKNVLQLLVSSTPLFRAFPVKCSKLGIPGNCSFLVAPNYLKKMSIIVQGNNCMQILNWSRWSAQNISNHIAFTLDILEGEFELRQKVQPFSLSPR